MDACRKGIPNGVSPFRLLRSPQTGGCLLCEHWACRELIGCAVGCLDRQRFHAGGHQLHRNGPQQSERDHRRPGRRLVVHELRKQLHRAHHDGRGRHQLHRNGHQQSERDHRRAGRRLVVHERRESATGSIGRITTGGVVTNFRNGPQQSGRDHRRPGRRHVVHQLGIRNRLHRAHHDGRGRHRLHRNGHQQSERDHRRPGRRLVVHQREQQLHRAHHDGRGRHQLHRNGHQQSERDHRRPGRRLVVHEQRKQLHRAHHDGRGRHQLHRNGHHNPSGITAGPDGALWFTNAGNSIGRITTAGVVTNYTGTGISNPSGITAGPDGALWFTNSGNNSIGRITTGSNPPPTTSVLIPSNGATLSGSTFLDASASNATSVEFRLFGGVYGFNAPVICTATPTYYGWLCSWNTTTVPNGSYFCCLWPSTRLEAHSVRASISPSIIRPRPRACSFLRMGRRCRGRPPLTPPPRTPQASSSGSSAALRLHRPGDLHRHADLLRMVVQLEHHDGAQRHIHT